MATTDYVLKAIRDKGTFWLLSPLSSSPHLMITPRLPGGLPWGEVIRPWVISQQRLSAIEISRRWR